MIRTHRHTRLVAILAALLLILSSSGFTALLHSCLMSGQGCCGEFTGLMSHMPMDEPPTRGTPVLKCDLTCCAITVAGGLNTSPIVAGSQQSAPQELDLIAVLPPSAAPGISDDARISSLTSSSIAASPPSVEKYVLHSSFLI